MAEVIDILFLFWVLVTITTYAIGSLVEKRLGNKSESSKQKSQRQQQQQQLNSSDWSAYNNSSSYVPQDHYNSSQYNSSLSPPQTSRSDFHYPGDQEAAYSSTAATYLANQPQSAANYLTSPRYTSESLDYSSGGALNRPSSPGQDYRQLHHYNDDGGAAKRRSLHQVEALDNTIPTATGFNADCVDWVNNILYLFYTQPHKYGPIITESVYRSLNEKLSNVISSSSDYNHLLVEFTGINRQQSSRPELTNIRTETESEKSVSAVCKIYNRRLQFELSVQRARVGSMSSYNSYSAGVGGGEDQEQLYELTLENLEGKLKSVAMSPDRLVVVQFMDKPDTKILLRAKNQYQDAKALINDDNLVSLVLQTLTQVVVDLYFGDDPDFPHYKQPQQKAGVLNLFKNAGEIKRHLKQDFLGVLGAASDKERKVFVKVVKARNINYNQTVTCLLELDQPHQQALSSTQQGSNPFWDEHFLFNVSDKSTSLRLELWDSAKLQRSGNGNEPSGKWDRLELSSSGAKFLGMAQVNVEELRREPVQRLSVGLASRPEESVSAVSARGLAAELSNSVGGELELELLFMEHSSSGAVQRSGSANSLGQTDVVSVERKLTPLGYVITTTTAITKPTPSQRRQQLARPPSALSSTSERSDLEAPSQVSAGEHQEQAEPEVHRSRSRSRSRSFLRAIKKRFSFSRTRSRSLGGESGRTSRADQSAAGAGTSPAEGQSMVSRASSEASLGRAKSVPTQREPADLPTIVISKGRLSDTASAYAFGAEPRSQLVLECLEPRLRPDGGSDPKGQLRHYLVSEEQARKWRRRGLKLHLFNEHQFVAAHLAGSSTCHLCGRLFSRRPGKQGYKCRNCHLLSHKQCHTKVDHSCPYVLKEALRLEYIDAEPPAALLREEERRRAGSLPRQPAGKRPARLGAKSVSMEAAEV